VTSTSARITVSGVRNSWLALATNRGRQAVEHAVDRVGQLAQLVGRAAHRDPLVHPLLGHPAREAGHAAQRRERAAGDEVAERHRHQQRATERERVLGVQAVERRVGEAGRQRPLDLPVHEPRAERQQQRSARSEKERVESGQAQAEGHTR
jgi:hypothetical protein